MATLRLRIRTLEEINRELKEQLEAAYGRLAVVPPKLGSYTERKADFRALHAQAIWRHPRTPPVDMGAFSRTYSAIGK